MAKKTNLPSTFVDWFCRKCWKSGVVTVRGGNPFVSKSPDRYAYDDHKASTPLLLCSHDLITWKVRPPVLTRRQAAAKAAAKAAA